MEYFIRLTDGTKIFVSDASPFTYKGISLFSHKVGNEYTVTEKTTGCQVEVSIISDKDAIKMAKSRIEKFSVSGIKKIIDCIIRIYNPSSRKTQPNLMEI